MLPFWKKLLIGVAGLFLLFISQPVLGQNCSVNAGVDEFICKGQPFILKGEANGLFFPGGSAIWTQLSGPSVSLGNQVVTGNSIRVNVNAFSQGQVYEFRISARCADGSQINQEVIFTTQPSTVANAGPDIPQICAGTLTMAANAPVTPLETGTWTKVSGPNVTIVNPSSPTTPVIVNAGQTGTTVLKWTISNVNGCATSSNVAFTSVGVAGSVSAGADQTLGACYNLTQNTNLQGSYAGNGLFGQSGTWTFVSGPTVPYISNPNNNTTSVSGLKEGAYTFRWNVSGPCANGTDEVTITVPAAKQAITSAGGGNRVFCDNTTSTIFSANPPSLTNETALWTVVSGSGTIVSPSSPTTVINGLTPGASSTFRYTITNNVTGCLSTGDYSVSYTTPPSISFINSSTFLPGTQTSITLPFTYSGGTQTSWQLVSGPPGSTLAPSGTTAFQNIGNATSLNLDGLDKFGTYRFRLIRYAPGGVGPCGAAAADGYVVVSLVPTASNPGTDIILACNINHTFLAANQPFVGTGSWSQVSGPNTATIVSPFSNITDVTGLTNGVYYFRWLISAGPGTPDQQNDVRVVVSSLSPTTANAGSNETICAGAPYKLKGNSPATNSEVGVWSVTPASGVIFGSVNDPNTKVTGLAANTTYTFTWTISNACGTSFSNVAITTNSLLGPNIASAGLDQCLAASATTFQLAGNATTGIETGAWKLVTGPMTPTITNSALNNTTVTGASNGTYLFEWSLSTPGCAASRDSVLITASAAATTASVTQSPVNSCGISSLTLNGNTPVTGTGLWTRLTGPGPVVITTPNSPTSTVTFLSPNYSYVFRWTISNGACASNFADVKYNISEAATPVSVGPDQVICGQSSTILTGSTITSGTGLWVLVSGPNVPSFSSLSNPTATLSGLVQGVYQLKWTAYNGLYCPQQESAILTITVRENATANVSAGGTCNASAVLLTGNTGSTGTWSTISGPNTPTLTPTSTNAAIASGLIGGTYTFQYALPAAGSCAASTATTSITLYSAPTIAQAGADQDLCGLTSTTLTGNTPVVGVGQWTIDTKPAGSTAVITNPSSPTSTITNLTPGDYLLQWTISNGTCTSNSDLVRVTYYAPPTPSNAGANQNNACSSEVQMNGNTPAVGIGTWTQISGAPVTIDAPNNPTTKIHGTAPGVYQFMWTISNGICQVSTSVVTITVSSTPPNLANAGPNQNICNTGVSATTTLAAVSPTGAESGLWTVQSKPAAAANPTITNATLYNTQVSGLVEGTYVLLWTLTNGACQSVSTVTLRVTNQPTPANAGADFSACLFKPVALSAAPVTTGMGTWSVFSKPFGSPDPVFDNENDPISKVFGLVSGNYIFTWSSNNGSGCATSTDQVSVQMVNPPTPAQAGNFQTICVGSLAVMTANSPTVGIGTWQLISGPSSVTIVSPNANNTTISGFVAGVYAFSWTIESGGCISSDQTQITVQPPVGNNTIGSPQLICSGTTAAALTGSLPTGGNGSSYSYQWQKSTTNSTTGFANISGANGINYSPGVLTTTSWYKRNVTSGACTDPFSSNTIEITVQPPITNNIITLPFTNIFCQSGDPQSITGALPTGGDGSTYAYQWQLSTISASTGFTNISGATTQNYDPPLLTTTTWYKRVVTSGTCIDQSAVEKITIYPYPVLTSFTATSRCNNLIFSYTATSSVAGTSYAWSQNSEAAINGGVAASGNTASINLQLNNALFVPVQTQFYYTLTANGCTNPTVFTVTVTVNPTPTVDIPNPPSQTVCNGLTTVAITFTGSPVAGTIYGWANNTTSIGLAASDQGNIPSFTAVNNSNVDVTATITVTPMSNSCNGLPKTSTILVHPTPNINTIAKATCTGISFSVVPANGTNGVVPANTKYRWEIPQLTAGLSGGSSGSNSSDINGIFSHTSVAAETATYTVIPSTTECGDAKPFTLVVTINPVADITPLSTTVCAGVTFQVSPVNPTDGRVPAGTKYTWLTPSGTGFSGGAAQGTQQNFISGNLTNTINTLSTATYVVTPVSGNCVGLSFTLQVNLKPKAIISPLSSTICSGLSFSVTPTDPGSGIIPDPTTFTWSTPTGISLSGLVSQSSPVSNIFGTLTNSSNIVRTATYLVTPLSGDCTGNVFSVTVFVNPLVAVTSFSRVTCSGANFSFSALNVTNGIVPAGTQYTWLSPTLSGAILGGSGGGPASSITGNLSHTNSSVLTATYVVTPSTSACGPGADFTLTVFINPIPIFTTQPTIVACGGSPFSITPTDGVDVVPFNTRYTWLAPSGSGFTGGVSKTASTDISGLLINSTAFATTATYFVTPTAPGNCAGAPFTVTVSLVANAYISALSTTTCSGVGFNFTPASGIIPTGTTYQWSSPSGSFISGGASGVGEAISGTLNNASNITRTATYVVTPLAGTCTGNSFTLTVHVLPIAILNPLTATICSGTSFTVSPTNGSNGVVPFGTLYKWSEPTGTGISGGVSQTTPVNSITGSLTNTTSNTVTATYVVTPSSGSCLGSDVSLVVTVLPKPSIGIITTSICTGFSFTVSPSNGTDGIVPMSTTYTWTIPSGTGFSGGAAQASGVNNITGQLYNTSAASVTATYRVTPTAANCVGDTFTVFVAVKPLPVISAMSTTICSGATYQFSPQNLTNGTVPDGTVYSVWNGATWLPATSPITGTLTNATASVQSTTYQVQPSVNGCVGQTFSATVFVTPVPSLNAIALTTCSGVSFGITPVNGSNGLVPIGTQYTWLEPTGSGFTGGLSQSLGVNNFSGKLTNITASIVTATYQLQSTYLGCSGNTFTVTVTVNPIATINSLSTSVCSGSPFSVSPNDIQDGLVPSGTLYRWLAPTGSGLTNGLSQTTPVSAISGNLTNTTASMRTAVYQVTPVSGSCTGTTFSLLVNVQPKASINPITAATCSGVGFTVDPSIAATGIIPAGTLYTWTTPLGTGFTGGAAQFSPVASITGTLTMTVATATSATYQITPVSGTCTGSLFTLVVNLQPKAAIQPIAISVCSGVTFNIVPLNVTNGIVPDGTQYTWLAPTGTGFSGGVSQSSAAGSISGKLFNTTVDAATAVYTVTPVFGACSSNSFTVTVQVKAQSFISAFSQAVCTGVGFTIIPAANGSNIIPSGTLYTWTAPAGSGFSGGLAQNSPVAAISGTLTNAAAQAVTAVYTVTPITNGCSGTIFTSTLFVQPAAAITAMSATICSGNSFVVVPAPTTNGVVPSGTLYSWSAPIVPNITGAAAGSLLTSINGNLTNTSASPISVTYQVSTISGACTGNVFTIVVLVKPVAAVQNLFTSTCSAVGFEISPQNGVDGLIPSTTKYSWLAPTGAGISNGSAGNLANTITGNLTNTTALVATATYIITPIADNCAGSSFTLVVQVKPKPTLNSVANASPICSGTLFQYSPTSATPGANFSWTYLSVSGITAPAPFTGTGAISQRLTNTTNAAITVTYIYALNADGCIGHGTDAVTVLVKPIPALAGNLTPANIYTGTVFNYNAQSTVAGSTFNWVRNSQTAINNNIGNSGSGAALSEVLTNSSSNIVFVPYQYTITAAGCLASQTVTVGVVPALVLSSTLTPSPVCSGTLFSYTATSDVPGITYAWRRNAINTINNNTAGNGIGAFISETLTSSAFVPVVVTYDVTLAAFGLSNTQQVTVIVQPTPSVQQPASQKICNQGNSLPIVFTGNVQGSQYQWVNDLPAIGLPASGTGNIPSFVGTNSSTIPLVANITVTPISNTCSGLPATFSITIQPSPTLSISLTATAICSGSTFTYTASSQTSNVSFTWQRETVSGITATGPETGVGNITNQVLRNISQSSLIQTYLYTLSANGCSNQQRVSVEVLPEPRLTSTTTPPAINGGNEFAYNPTSSLPSTQFIWVRPVVTGITNPAATGSNNIREILFNPTTGPITVTYTYSLLSGGCFGTVDVTLRVNPNRTTLFPGAISGTQSVCIGSPAVAFTSLSPATGGNGTINYRWQSSLDNITFTDIPGATALTYAAGTLSQTTYFRRVAVSGDQEFATNVVLVTVNKAIPPAVTPAGPLFLVTGGNFTLSSTTAVAYIWSNSATTQSITVTAPGGYRVTITDANGCKDTSNLVAVSPPPPLTVNATYIIGNPNNPPNSGGQVTGLPGAQLKYYLLSAGGTVIPVPALPSSPGTFTYYVSQVINGYESIRVPYAVTMIEPFKISDPQKVLSSKPEIQPDGSYIIRFSFYFNNNLSVLLDSIRMKDDLTKVFPAAVQFEVMSLKASGTLVANQQYNGSSNIELLSDGSKLNPSAKDSINLVIRMVPNGFFGILKNTATLTAKTPYGTLTVNSNDPSIGTGVGNREPTPFEIPGVEIFVPGGFSPNQDGINDYLVIRRPSTTTLQLEIFNRWGNPVYRAADYKNDWNGRTNQPGNVLGPEIPDGTYYYIVTGTDRISGKITRLNGFITVKR
jgi:gliding motility-associated-like protein